MARLLEVCLPLSPSSRAKVLEDSQEIELAYRTVALQGDSEVPENPEDEVDYHYVCFVKASKNNHIYELDGDKKGPVDHGYCPKDVLDEVGLKIVRSYIDREKGGNVNFSLLALIHA